jgi:hypothetical protein
MTHDALTQLIDRQAITNILYRYCRGVDRMNLADVAACYWPGAIDNHGVYAGDVEGFLDFLKQWEPDGEGAHLVTNVMIDFQSAQRALVESYVVSISTANIEGEVQDMSVGGRYLDWFEKRDGQWRIAERTLVIDWNRLCPTRSAWDRAHFPLVERRGAKSASDPLYEFLDWQTGELK